jgi:hypothetical protein
MRQSLSVQSHETVRLTVKNYLDSDVVILSEDAPVSLRHVLQLLLAPVTVVVLLLVLFLLQLLQPKRYTGYFPAILFLYFLNTICVQYSTLVTLSDRLTASALVNFMLLTQQC